MIKNPTYILGAKSMCVLLSLMQSARMNKLSPDSYITFLLRHFNDLKDERMAVSYLPWSEKMKGEAGLTKKEIDDATREVEKDISEKKIAK